MTIAEFIKQLQALELDSGIVEVVDNVGFPVKAVRVGKELRTNKPFAVLDFDLVGQPLTVVKGE
jgi:hypothetical protein